MKDRNPPHIIFLDFDGVLNTEKYQAELYANKEPRSDKYGPLFDPEAVENLRMILDVVPDAQIVISSSWKLEGLQRMKNMWKDRGLPGQVAGITPNNIEMDWNINLDEVSDYSSFVGRGKEIRQWLSDNTPEGCRYVIFDDLPDYLPEQEEHLVTTIPYKGISHDDALMAISILEGKR